MEVSELAVTAGCEWLAAPWVPFSLAPQRKWVSDLANSDRLEICVSLVVKAIYDYQIHSVRKGTQSEGSVSLSLHHGPSETCRYCEVCSWWSEKNDQSGRQEGVAIHDSFDSFANPSMRGSLNSAL